VTHEPDGEPPAPLVATAWRLVRLGGKPVEIDAPVTLAFAGAGRIGGSAGCNRYGGPVELDAASIRLGPLFSTRMACPEPLMAIEAAYLAALEAATAWRLHGDRLVLHGETQLEFELDVRASDLAADTGTSTPHPQRG
jgi:putative lipoprotein